MTTTTFVAGTVVAKEWLNDTNTITYGLANTSDATKGAALVGFSHANNYVAGTVGLALNSVVSVTNAPYNAKGDGVTDDAPAIQAAITAAGISGRLYFPKGTYLCNSALVQLQSQSWEGNLGQRATTLKKGFNGDLVTLGTLGTITGINLDGAGATYTGRGFYVNNGFSQRLERCRASNTKGPSLEFANGVGGGSHVSDFEGNTIDQTTIPAILLAGDTGPSPRFFDGIWLSGGLFQLGAGAGNGSSLTNFYIRNFITTGPALTGSALMHISNGRVASITDTTVLSGSDIQFVNVAFSGPVYLDNAQGYELVNCTYGSSISENQTTCNFNMFEAQSLQYTPVWTQPSGSPSPSIGNGIITATYIRRGYVCTVSFRLFIGSTTNTGNTSSAYSFSLPFKALASLDQRGLICTSYSATSLLDYTLSGSISASQSIFTLGYNSQAVRKDYPATWSVGSEINGSFTYMVG